VEIVQNEKAGRGARVGLLEMKMKAIDAGRAGFDEQNLRK